jgi:hypothetical protein
MVNLNKMKQVHVTLAISALSNPQRNTGGVWFLWDNLGIELWVTRGRWRNCSPRFTAKGDESDGDATWQCAEQGESVRLWDSDTLRRFIFLPLPLTLFKFWSLFKTLPSPIRHVVLYFPSYSPFNPQPNALFLSLPSLLAGFNHLLCVASFFFGFLNLIVIYFF